MNKCNHNVNQPPHSIVVDPITFIPFCQCCKVELSELLKVNPITAAYDRAMSIIKQ